MKKGFTLIETFVAITILVIAVIGPLSLLAQAIANGNYAKNQITAYYLAQEGQELVINQRDTIRLNPSLYSTDWLSGLESCINPINQVTNFCQIDAYTSKVSAVNPDDLEAMRKGESHEGLFFFDPDDISSSDALTIYKRYIYIEKEDEKMGDPTDITSYAPAYAKVYVTVEWNQANLQTTQKITLVTTIFKI